MTKKKTFCLDVASLDEEQQAEFAETLKTTVDEFNQTLETEVKPATEPVNQKNQGESLDEDE